MSKKAKKTKTNPYHVPATLGDVEKLKRECTAKATRYVFAVTFSVLLDKEGFTADDAKRVYDEINELSDSIVKGYINLQDLMTTLETEYGILLTD